MIETSEGSRIEAISANDADADIDDEFAELPPRRRVPLFARVALIGILATVAFGGGVLVQKNHDAANTSTAAAGPPAGLGGAGLGGFSGGAGGAGGTGGGVGTGGTGSGSQSSGGASATTPVLIGNVVSVAGNDVTVKDLGGASHVVHLSGTATVVVSTTTTAAALKPGASVSVTGTKAADGSVAATGLTSK